MKTIILAIVITLACVHSISCIKCMACTYTFAGPHGLYDRECVTDVRGFIKTSVIQCSEYCMTKAVYVRGYTRLNSLYRGCGYKRERFCDHPHVIIPTCERTCREDECNDGNGDLWKRWHPHSQPDLQGEGGDPDVGSVMWTIGNKTIT